MDTLIVDKDIKILCLEANSFPDGILEAHEKLRALIAFSKGRRYYGISRPEQGVIVYKAAAEELENDKDNCLNCQSMIIKKGIYRCIDILDYKKDLQSIGQAFGKLCSYPDIDPLGYCIEWYYSDRDVKCMVRLKGTQFLSEE